MNANDFEKKISKGGKIIYLHVPTGIKRQEILNNRLNGKITQQEFEIEQKKMRTGKYLKYLYSESAYLKAVETSTAPKNARVENEQTVDAV